MTRTFSVAVIAGDGIGPEVIPPAVEAVNACGRRFGFTADWAHYDWGSARYQATGRLMPDDGLDRLRGHDAILFGAVGRPDIPDTTTLWGLLIPIRRGFDQYINLRPVRHIPGMPSPLSDPDGIDIVVVRENVEGEYSDVGGRRGAGENEYAVQEARFTHRGVTRVAAYAAELARRRSGRLTSATKSNGILHTMPFWDEQVAAVVSRYPDVTLRPVLIDALAAEVVRRPRELDVIVASNLFGDILSDLTAAVVGSLGIAASANINPERDFPSLFEPVHGSAPDIAGTGVANPVAAIYSAAMMLGHLGQAEAAACLTAAADAVLRDGPRTPDLGGRATTGDVASAVLARIGVA